MHGARYDQFTDLKSNIFLDYNKRKYSSYNSTKIYDNRSQTPNTKISHQHHPYSNDKLVQPHQHNQYM